MPTLSQASVWLKTVYLTNEDIEQYNKNTLMYQLFKKDSTFVKGGGLGIEWPIMDVRNTGGGAIDTSTMAMLPPGSHNGADATDTLRMTEWGVFFDSILFHSAVTNEQAFFNVVDMEMTKAFDDMRNGESRMMWGDGTGVLGVISAIGAINAQNLYPITLAGGVTSFFPATLFLQPGQYITFLSAAYAAIGGQAGIQIASSDDVNGIIYVASVAGLAVGNVITNYLANTKGTAVSNEPNGLRALYGNNNTLFGINPTNDPKWTPAVVDVNNTDPTENLFAYLRSFMQLSGVKSKVGVTHPLTLEKYAAGVLATRRTVNTQEYEGGIETTDDYNQLEGPMIYGIGKLLGDPNTPMGVNPNTSHLWIGDPKLAFIEQVGDQEWLEEDGKILHLLVGGASVASPTVARYVAYIVHYWSMCTFKRKGGAMATNVNMLQV